MEVDVAFSAWAEHAKKVEAKLDKFGRMKPVHKQALSGSVAIGAVAPTTALVEIQPHVSAGRVWNVLGVNIFSADGHTPIAQPATLNSSGTAAAPGANGIVSGATATALANTTYQINWSVSVSGTLAAIDANNMKLVYSGAVLSPIVYPEPGGASGTVFFNTGPGAPTTFHINAIAASTAGSVYAASVNAFPVSSVGVLPSTFADIFGGAVPSLLPILGGTLSDELVSAAAIPSINFVPDKAVWLHQDESVYAIIYNPPANSNYILTARVAEFPVEAVEALEV